MPEKRVVTVQDNSAAHNGAQFRQRFVIHGRVGEFGGNAPAGRPSHLHCLESPATGDAPTAEITGVEDAIADDTLRLILWILTSSTNSSESAALTEATN